MKCAKFTKFGIIMPDIYRFIIAANFTAIPQHRYALDKIVLVLIGHIFALFHIKIT